MSLVSSLELWTSAKFIGRECSTVNKEYLICKKTEGANPKLCSQQADLVTTCADNVVANLKTKYPKEFTAFSKCLDYNDYRIGDCKKTEQALRDAWNADNASA